jgi:lactate permease
VNDLPVDLLHWGLAILPLVVLLLLLTVFSWKAPQAGPVGMVLAAVVAVTAFRTPLDTLAAALGAGVWDAIFVLLVVWPAILLYRVADGSGAFAALREGIRRYSKNQLFLVLAFGWVFASFLQGIAGFGVPVAVVAPLLLAVGVKPVMAVVIALIGHAWANMFGTLGVGWLAMEQVVDIEDSTGTAVQTALLLWVPNLLAGFTIAWLFGRWAAVRHATPMVLVVSLIHGGGQLAGVLVSPVLSTFLATTVALLALYPLSRWKRYGERAEEIDERPAVAEAGDDEPEPVMGFAWSLLPYGVLTLTSIVALAVPPVTRALEAWSLGFPLGGTTTGYGVENPAEDPYSPIEPLTHPVTFLVLAVLVTWAVYRAKGFATAWQERAGRASAWAQTATDAVPSSVAIVSFLVLAAILDFSGQVDVLALGISSIAPAPVYAFVAATVGGIGAFMTSSSTSSNILLSQLQTTVAGEEGLSQAGILAAQGAGGSIANAVAPANVVLGTTTAGIVGKEGDVLKRTLPWTGAVLAVVGAITVVLA